MVQAKAASVESYLFEPGSGGGSAHGNGGGNGGGGSHGGERRALPDGIAAPVVAGSCLDHDLVVWAGDLNYALHESVDGAEARAGLEGGGGDVMGPRDGELRTQWAAADQLTAERSLGRAFTGFREGGLFFRPTYRVKVGADAYDPKRCPAWTDRVLWREKKSARSAASLGPASAATPAAGAVSLVAYSCSWDCRLSDHKPVFAVLDVDVAGLR